MLAKAGGATLPTTQGEIVVANPLDAIQDFYGAMGVKQDNLL